MVKVDPSLWTVLCVVGMILLAAGTCSVMFIVQPETVVSAVFIIAGIILILIASVFISLDGRDLRKEDAEYRRFEAIRDEARLVPDDLDESYMIDYTAADPNSGISFRRNAPSDEIQRQEENSVEHSEEDIVIRYS
ncbi:MAG: hypothetical protein FWF07_02080 [Methanomassiliicoccaceae archaeon]|nr:hypothetical protein [Methanomassiliicoccaceae archaeon]